ncbi:MAG: hypothetical protein DRR19_10845 [Candidatus Parabeggiatoa sp. nov. 1]|nr:MAG: hypothetical protein DRR19_10845 [Gammaproteobacteria bacterium]
MDDAAENLRPKLHKLYIIKELVRAVMLSLGFAIVSLICKKSVQVVMLSLCFCDSITYFKEEGYFLLNEFELQCLC